MLFRRIACQSWSVFFEEKEKKKKRKIYKERARPEEESEACFWEHLQSSVSMVVNSKRENWENKREEERSGGVREKGEVKKNKGFFFLVIYIFIPNSSLALGLPSTLWQPLPSPPLPPTSFLALHNLHPEQWTIEITHFPPQALCFCDCV